MINKLDQPENGKAGRVRTDDQSATAHEHSFLFYLNLKMNRKSRQ